MLLAINNKQYDLSDVEEFVHQMYGEGWCHIISISTTNGEIRTFEDKQKNKYQIIYKYNSYGVLIPKEIMRICINQGKMEIKY